MRIALLGALAALLMACSTTGNTQAPFTLKDGHTAEFKAGDCATVDKNHPKARLSDGTPSRILYVDRKYVGYIVYMDHPKLQRPSVFGQSIKKFDKYWKSVDCPE